jgi:putative ABC transport system permease protein
MTHLWQDLRYALRNLRRSPGFAAAAIATLALGIGANTAIFSVMDAVLLRPLPYPASGQLAMVGDRTPSGGAGNVGYLTYLDLRERNRTFASLAAIRLWAPTLVNGGEAERVPAMRVSANYFDVLGVRPALGRTFSAEQDRPDTWRVLVLSDGLWRRKFGADPSVIGRRIRMNDADYQIVGVMPASYEPLLSAHFYTAAEMWAPLGYDPAGSNSCRSCQHLKAVGRLRDGVSLDQARSDLDRVRRVHAAQYPSD